MSEKENGTSGDHMHGHRWASVTSKAVTENFKIGIGPFFRKMNEHKHYTIHFRIS